MIALTLDLINMKKILLIVLNIITVILLSVSLLLDLILYSPIMFIFNTKLVITSLLLDGLGYLFIAIDKI